MNADIRRQGWNGWGRVGCGSKLHGNMCLTAGLYFQGTLLRSSAYQQGQLAQRWAQQDEGRSSGHRVAFLGHGKDLWGPFSPPQTIRPAG